MSNTNPFVAETPTETLDNCSHMLELLMDAQSSDRDGISEETIMARQLIYSGLMDAMEHTANVLGDVETMATDGGAA